MSLSVSIYKQLGDFTLDVSFETEGGVLGLLGASGCGKSYTLKCIAGIERPDRGRIVLDDTVFFDSEKHIDLPPQKRQVGYLFQNYALFPNMTVRQNILCGLHREKDKARREAALQQMLSFLQLEPLVNHRPAQLSGGQAQRVALARILVNQPRLLMLDEPFSALDSHLRERLQLEMQELLKQFGKDVLLVTHSRDEAYHLCSRIAVMDEGHLLALQDTKKLFADPGDRRAAALTGCKNIAEARKAGEYEVEVPEWGVRFTTAQPVREGLTAIGIRAHYFNPRSPQNRQPVTFVGGMEEPFEFILEFRFPNQRPDSPSVWWRVPKDRIPTPYPGELGVAPANILLFYS
ncbi:MAG: ATP-binding cassette domain-containing protein [Clostridiales bacterium]|nr:ATP-binding cassette domain-containing protein [Clostridiales bacterium]MCD8366424.1 ATP-binding cassette domain-containing protein [Clostridiales bacterium]